MEKKNSLLGLLFVFAMIILGFFLGGFMGRLFGSDSDMGWDQLADALGGMMVGVVAGLVLGAVIVQRLTNRQRIIGIVGSLVLSVLTIIGMRMYNQYDRNQSSPTSSVDFDRTTRPYLAITHNTDRHEIL